MPRRPHTAEERKRYNANSFSTKYSAMATIKLERGCADCGYNADPVALDFDHVRGEKKFIVGHIMGHGLPALLNEAAKCDVVCANCHRIRTTDRKYTKTG
jgi:hypothetical protein